MRPALLLVIACLLSSVLSAQVPKALQGYWFLVNGLGYVHIAEDGSAIEKPSDTKGTIEVKSADTFVWHTPAGERTCKLEGDNLRIENILGRRVHAWLRMFEYRRYTAEDSKSLLTLIDLHARSTPLDAASDHLNFQAQIATSTRTIDRRAIELKVRNNLRWIASAADHHMLETGTKKVTYPQIMAGRPDLHDSFKPVDGEDYSTIEIRKGEDAFIEVTTRSGITVRYRL